jgi:hypothetical protein
VLRAQILQVLLKGDMAAILRCLNSADAELRVITALDYLLAGFLKCPLQCTVHSWSICSTLAHLHADMLGA